METKEIGKVMFDYYEEMPSYVKTIVDALPDNKASIEKKEIIKILYNLYMNKASNEKVEEIVEVSKMFRNKLNTMDLNTITLQVDYMYKVFLNKFIFDTFNRDIVFDAMTDNAKFFSGYYEKNNNKIRNESSVLMSYSRR